jgi:hypothetical protein
LRVIRYIRFDLSEEINIYLVERSWKGLPKRVIAPYTKSILFIFEYILEYFEERMLRRNLPARAGKAKYHQSSIVNQYREGKLKSSPERAMK